MTSEDPSLEDGWSADQQYTTLCQTTALMGSMLAFGRKTEQQSNAPSMLRTSHTTEALAWPVPSSKEWTSIGAVVVRAVAVLGWLCGRIASRGKAEASPAHLLTSFEKAQKHAAQKLLMESLLQLLDSLLTGKTTADFLNNVC